MVENGSTRKHAKLEIRKSGSEANSMPVDQERQADALERIAIALEEIAGIENKEKNTTKQENFECPYCGKEYEIQSYYKKHVQQCFG